MLNAKTIEIVKSTAPVLKEHRHEIGKRFYELLFTKAPELYNVFNQTNQKRGLQQDALANGVYAAGEHIDNLDTIHSMITRITQKHRALGIQPEQYPVVGETLLQAVKDVLGDTATDEIIEAWGNAYREIAEAFINVEKKLYDEAEQAVGGWKGFRDFIVDKKVKESDVITSFYLKPKDGQAISSYQAGQYLTLKATIKGEKYTHMRHYSLSDSPGKNYYRISVKREDAHDKAPDGVVSNYLHQQIHAGDVLQFSAPAGDFTLIPSNKPIVLMSGGIGITPLLSMLLTSIENETDSNITFIHSTTNSKVHAFKKEMAELAKIHDNVRFFVSYENPTEEDYSTHNFDKEGFIDLNWLQSILPSNDAHFYICGGLTFMEAMTKILKQWQVPKDSIHIEVFNPMSLLDEEDNVR